MGLRLSRRMIWLRLKTCDDKEERSLSYMQQSKIILSGILFESIFSSFLQGSFGAVKC